MIAPIGKTDSRHQRIEQRSVQDVNYGPHDTAMAESKTTCQKAVEVVKAFPAASLATAAVTGMAIGWLVKRTWNQ